VAFKWFRRMIKAYQRRIQFQLRAKSKHYNSIDASRGPAHLSEDVYQGSLSDYRHPGHVKVICTDSAVIYDFSEADNLTVIQVDSFNASQKNAIARIPINHKNASIKPNSAINGFFTITDHVSTFTISGFDTIEFLSDLSHESSKSDDPFPDIVQHSFNRFGTSQTR